MKNADGKGSVKKENLPRIKCMAFGKYFDWRKKWEKVWDEVNIVP